jgi:hypothetical protein
LVNARREHCIGCQLRSAEFLLIARDLYFRSEMTPFSNLGVVGNTSGRGKVANGWRLRNQNAKIAHFRWRVRP